MQPQYAYTETKISEISGELNKIFASMQDPETSYTRSAASNMIVPLSSPQKTQDLEPVLDLLSRVRPSRFFVVLVDNSLQKVRAEISARCHIVGKKEHVCSEVVRIASPRGQVKALPSILRANFLTGTSTELFLYDPMTEDLDLGSLMAIADEVMFDSKKFSGHLEILERLLGTKAALLDFAWIGYANWRDQVRGVFERPSVGSWLRELETVSIHSNSDQNEVGQFLLAGWLVDRLGLHVQTYSQEKYKCSSRFGTNVSLEFTFVGKGARSSKDAQQDVQQIVFSFKNGATVEIGKQGRELVARASAGQVNGALAFETHTPIDEESLESRISKYFSVGVSTANYRSALRNALQLRARWKA